MAGRGDSRKRAGSNHSCGRKLGALGGVHAQLESAATVRGLVCGWCVRDRRDTVVCIMRRAKSGFLADISLAAQRRTLFQSGISARPTVLVLRTDSALRAHSVDDPSLPSRRRRLAALAPKILA